MNMKKVQPSFDFGWLEEQQPSRPHDSALFVAYIKTVVPQLLTSDKPIHKTAQGYATNSSPWSEYGQWEFDAKEQVIRHRHKTAQWVGDKYEYTIIETPHRVEFLNDRMMVS